jgi:hypothetical protein
MTRIRTLSALALIAAAAPAAAAQAYREEPPAAAMRPGMPDVNARRPEADPQAGAIETAAAFRGWYARASRPTMMVFWNRELTDETSTERSAVVTTRERADAWSDRNGAHAERSARTEVGGRNKTGGTYAAMGDLRSAELEAAFQTAWLDNGVKLLDRTALVRKTSATAVRGDREDLQFLETVALERGVQYLVEVLPTPQGASPTGWVFMVRVKHLPSSRMVAQFNTQAAPAAGPERLVAAPGGFERRRDTRAATPETVGTELAFQTMARLR